MRTRTEDRIEKAFRLAFFIHGDVETAKEIAFGAMNKLETASNAQYKRTYYTPCSSRKKVSVNDSQLLQRLVFVESEPFEKEKEFAETTSERDLLIYFIKHLIRITLKRNSFYVTLGLSRILHNYATSEVMELYNVVVQDPEKVHDDYYYRSRKGVLMKELKNRFGERLEIVNSNRGEQRFLAKETCECHQKAVQKSLEFFKPWNTECVLPEKVKPFTEVIEKLCFNGKFADDEHRVEVNRMHSVLHRECFVKLAKSLNLALPEEKLEVPRFIMKNNKQNNDWDNNGNPPTLEDNDLKKISAMLERESERRKSANSGFLRIVVDGEETARFDAKAQNFYDVKFNDEFSELLEVYSIENGKDVLLATYLMTDGETRNACLKLEGGQKISFNFNENNCRILYRETNFAAKFGRFREMFRDGNFSILRPAFASLLLLLVFSIGILFLSLSDFEQQQVVSNEAVKDETKNPQNFVIPQNAEPEKKSVTKIPADKSAKSADVKKVREKKQIESKPIELAKLEMRPRSVEKDGIGRFPIIEKIEKEKFEISETRSIKKVGKFLKDIKFVYVEAIGDDKYGRQIGEQMIDLINANKRFIAVNNKEKADGLLKISVRREADNGKDENTVVSAIVRLVNADGFVISPGKKRVSAWKYVGEATKLPAQIVKDLAAQK